MVPGFFLGLGNFKRWPSFISFGYYPVSAALLRISAISMNTISGASLINSAGKLSEPVLLLFLNLFAQVLISSGVKGFVNLTGSISIKMATCSRLKSDSKN